MTETTQKQVEETPLNADQPDMDELLKRRRSRSIAMALVLGALVVLFYTVSLVKGPGVLDRPL